MSRRFGFVRDKTDIKILILFILRRIDNPATLDELTELTMCDDGISYFDYMECIAELIKTEHLTAGDDGYSITEKGERNGEVTEDSLPYSVRLYFENSTLAHRGRKIRDAMIKTFHKIDQNGNYTVVLSLSDGLAKVASLELFAVNKQQAVQLEKGFRKNAESVYSSLIEKILSDM